MRTFGAAQVTPCSVLCGETLHKATWVLLESPRCNRSVAPGVEAAALLHAWTACLLHAAGAGGALVIADALIKALVATALHQVGHAGGTASGVALLAHAVLGAGEASSTRTAALVQGAVETLATTRLPGVQIRMVGACSAALNVIFDLNLLLLILIVHEGFQVVHLHATQLVQFQAAILASGACVICFQRRLHICCCHSQEQHHQAIHHGGESG